MWQTDATQWAFSGISTFAHLEHVKCLKSRDQLYDIAVLGAPFDTAVSYRVCLEAFSMATIESELALD